MLCEYEIIQTNISHVSKAMCMFYPSTFHSTKPYLLLKLCNINFSVGITEKTEKRIVYRVMSLWSKLGGNKTLNNTELSLDLLWGTFFPYSIQSYLDWLTFLTLKMPTFWGLPQQHRIATWGRYSEQLPHEDEATAEYDTDMPKLMRNGAEAMQKLCETERKTSPLEWCRATVFSYFSNIFIFSCTFTTQPQWLL